MTADLDLDDQARCARSCRRSPTASRMPTSGRTGRRSHVTPPRRSRRQAAHDPRRRDPVFAREGFHRCRVSDIAKRGERRLRARLSLLSLQGRGARHALHRALEPAARGDRRGRRSDAPVREKLRAVAVVHHRVLPQRPRPDEGDHRRGDARRQHLRPGAPREIREAYEGIAGIVESGQEDGTFRTDISAEFATLCFYGAIEQLLTGWIFDELPKSAGRVRARQAGGRRDGLRRARGPRLGASRGPSPSA